MTDRLAVTTMSTGLTTPPRSPGTLSRLMSGGSAAGRLSPLSVEALDGTLTQKKITASPRHTRTEGAATTNNASVDAVNGISSLSVSGGGGGGGDTSPNYGPLGHRPSLIRLSSGSRAPKMQLSLPSPSSSSPSHARNLSNPSLPPQPPVTSPQTIDDLQPQMVGPPGKAFETGFQQIYMQNEIAARTKERHRQKVLRTSSLTTGLPCDDAERERFRMEQLKRMRSEMMMTVGQPSRNINSAAAHHEDDVDEAIERATSADQPEEGRPGFSRSFTEPSRMTRRNQHATPDQQNGVGANGNLQPIVLGYKSEAPGVAAAASAEATAAARAQAEFIRQSMQVGMVGMDEDEQKGDRESANLPSPAGASALSRLTSANGNVTRERLLEIRLPDAMTDVSTIPTPYQPSQPSYPPQRSPSSSRSSSRHHSGMLVLGQLGSRSPSPQPSPRESRQVSRQSSRQSSRQPSPTSAAGQARQTNGVNYGNHPSDNTGRLLSPSSIASSPTPRTKRRVFFSENLCQHDEYVAYSRSHTPPPLHPNAQPPQRTTNGKMTTNVQQQQQRQPPSSTRLKSIYKKPQTHHVSNVVSHVVKQVMNGVDPPNDSPLPFSLHAPYASPASILRLQVALFHDSLYLSSYCTTVTRTGSILIKYNSSGKPMKRWFYVEETSKEVKLCWSAPKYSKTKPLWEVNPNGLGYGRSEEEFTTSSSTSTTSSSDQKEQYDPVTGKPILMKSKHKSASSSSSSSSSSSHHSILPAFTIGKWKFNQDRSRSLLEVSGIHYGPYYSANFCRFLDKMDSATGKPWLCFSIQFKDRTIDLVGANEHEVTAWFLGLQSQSPQTCYHMTRAQLLWQRLIMKLNYYGLEQIKRVFAKREAMAAAANAK